MRIYVTRYGRVMSRRCLVLVASSIALVLALSLLAEPSQAEGAKTDDKTAEPAKVTERPDRVSAMSTAQDQKSRVEDLSARTPSSSVFAEKDGTWTVETYSGPIRAQNGKGSWVDLDTDVEKDGGDYAPKVSAVDLSFSDGGDKTIATLDPDNADAIGVGWPEDLPKPTIDGDVLTYPKAAADGGDLVVQAIEDGFNYSVTVPKAPTAGAAPVEYRFPLKLGGADASVTEDGSVEITDGKKRVMSAPTPLMWDTSGADKKGETQPVAASIEGTGDNSVLVLKPDMDFLTDPGTQFPVTVDPTFVVAAAADTWVQSTGDTSSQLTSPELRVGSNDAGATKARSLVYFDLANVSNMPAFEVNSAQVNLSNFETGACTGSDLEMSRITGGWFTGSVTWGTQPAVTTAGASRSAQSFGATGCTTEGVVSFDATSILKSWVGGSTNLGVRIAALDETAASGWRKFRSNEAGIDNRRVRLVANYNSYPTKPDASQATPAISDGSTLITSSAKPKFTSSVTDPDGGNLTTKFKLMQGSTTIENTTLGTVPSGSAVYRTSPTLADGTYTAQWQTSDGTLDSPWSDPTEVVVDTTAPAAPGVACTSMANGSWYDTKPASTSDCTITAASGTQTIEATLNGETTTFPDLSSGSTSKTFTLPTDGLFDLAVTAKDKAGNASKTTFKTGIGTGAMVSPNDQDRSTDAFMVAGTSKGDAISAQLQWRLAGDSAATWSTASQVRSGLLPWPGLPSTSGNFANTGALTWNAAAETGMSAPSIIETRFCFAYSGTPSQRCTATKTLNLVPHAIGGTFPTSDLGPGQVALMTGEYAMDETDVSVAGYGEDLTVGRSYTSLGSASSVQSDVFGPGWTADIVGPDGGFASASVVDKTATNATITLQDADGSAYTYLHSSKDKGAQKDGAYLGQGETALDNDTLSIATVGTTKYLTLLENDGTKTVWKHIGAGVWSIDHIDESRATGTTSFTLDSAGRVTGLFAPAPSGVTCNATTQDRGCRSLTFTYTTVGSDKRLSQIDLKTWDPKPTSTGLPGTDAAMATKTVAKYAYDSSGRLTEAWDPRMGDGAAAIKTTYTYQSVGAHTMLDTITDPAQKPWRLGFDSFARIATVKRQQDAAVGVGDATWAVSYDLATSGSGQPDVSASAVTSWGQPQAPEAGAAVFGPDAPGTSDLTFADLSYFTKEGRTTNTAAYGADAWQINSTGYDSVGNTVWELEEGNRNRALAADGDTAAAANLLSTKALYTGGGTRVKASWEPSRSVVLANGTVMTGRPKTYNIYDDEADSSLVPGRPTPVAGDPPQNLLVETRDFLASTDDTNGFDKATTRYRYDKVASTDGNGWTLGIPTRVSTSLGSGWSTELTRFDTEGKVIETRTPQGVSTTDGAGSDARSTITRYYSADASSPDAACRNKPEWADEVCVVAKGAAYSTIPVERMTGYDYQLDPTRVEETSSPMARTTVTTFDAAGRKTADSQVMTGALSGDQPIPDRNYTYSATTGDVVSTTSGGQTIAKSVDSWGRTLTQSDGTSNTATTTYDAAGRTKTFDDGKGVYTYTYDGTDAAGKTERRGMITKLDVGLASGPDEFTAAYDPDGQNVKLVYPNGLTATSTFDEGGNQTGLQYANGSTNIVGFARVVDPFDRARVEATPLSRSGYTYDERGRLAAVRDYVAGACTTRTYTLSLDSNRTDLQTGQPGVAGACSTSTSSTVSTSYDITDRITDTGYGYDYFGRTRSVPANHTDQPTGGGLSARYFANDMVASISQRYPATSGPLHAKTYGLDASLRLSTLSEATDGVELRKTTNHYADGTDSPAWIDEQTRPDGTSGWASTWTRNVMTPGGGIGLIQASDGSSKIQLANLHGDIVSTMVNTTGQTALANYTETTEYGLTRPGFTSLGQNYGWLGTNQRSMDTVGGLMLMGARLYNPAAGRFLSMDPVPGGNDNTYTYPADPINAFDVDGCRQDGGQGANYCKRNGKVKYLRGRFLGRPSRWHRASITKKFVFKLAATAVLIFLNRKVPKWLVPKRARGIAGAIAILSMDSAQVQSRTAYSDLKVCRRHQWRYQKFRVGGGKHRFRFKVQLGFFRSRYITTGWIG